MDERQQSALRIAVWVPCRDEVEAIAKVVADFRTQLLSAQVAYLAVPSWDAGCKTSHD